ncbi:MAG: hypothetical protein P8170_03200 [Gemmatimonadota bacterium]|jgi:hypothetical protein
MKLSCRVWSGWLRSRRPLLVVLASLAPVGARGQSLEEQVIQRRLEFQQAELEYEAARAALSVVDRQFSAALNTVREAHRTGDDQALESAYAQAQARSGPLAAQERRVDEARQRLAEARQAFVEVLNLSLQQLAVAMSEAPTELRLTEIDAIYRDRRAELSRLEDGGEEHAFRIDVAILPDINFDPRDGPEELETKAQLVEAYAALVDTVISDIDRRVELLNEQARSDRQREDLLRAVGRFDDTNLPVGVTTGPPGSDAAADSTGVGNRPLTLEERIEELMSYRAQLVGYRDQVLIKARTFRSRLRSIV